MSRKVSKKYVFDENWSLASQNSIMFLAVLPA
jgi:hypothetical protein